MYWTYDFPLKSLGFFFDRQVSRTIWPIWARLYTLLEWVQNKPYFKVWSLLLKCAFCDVLAPSPHSQWLSLSVFTTATSPSTLRPLGPLRSLWVPVTSHPVYACSIQLFENSWSSFLKSTLFRSLPYNTPHPHLSSPQLQCVLLPLSKTSVFCAGSSSQLILWIDLLLIGLTVLRFWIYNGWQ